MHLRAIEMYGFPSLIPREGEGIFLYKNSCLPVSLCLCLSHVCFLFFPRPSVNEPRSKPSRDPQTPARSEVEPPPSASPSEPPSGASPHSPSGPDQRQSAEELVPTPAQPDRPAEETQPEAPQIEEQQERSEEQAVEEKPGAERQPQVEEEEEKTGVEEEVEEEEEEEAELEMEGEEESEKERILVEVEESSLLSEKERQNEEVNEKDNCSASSISSASSTLEREEKEEKLSGDNNSGRRNTVVLTLTPRSLKIPVRLLIAQRYYKSLWVWVFTKQITSICTRCPDCVLSFQASGPKMWMPMTNVVRCSTAPASSWTNSTARTKSH